MKTYQYRNPPPPKKKKKKNNNKKKQESDRQICHILLFGYFVLFQTVVHVASPMMAIN